MASTQQVMLAISPRGGGYFFLFYDTFDPYPTGDISSLPSGYSTLNTGPFYIGITTGKFYKFDRFGWDDFDSYALNTYSPNTVFLTGSVNSGAYFYNGVYTANRDRFGWDKFDNYATGYLASGVAVLNGAISSGVSLTGGYIHFTG